MQYVFQLFPVILAVIAIFSCTKRYGREQRKPEKVTMILAVCAALLMIIAQLSWSWTFLVEGNLIGTWFANTIWTIFNGLVMTCFIYMSTIRR